MIKLCRKCQQTFPATLKFFYKNAGGKFGLTPRCKPCVNQDNKESHAKRDPEIVRAQQLQRTKRHYYKDLDASREKQRKAQAKARQNPERRAVIQARKRAGGAGLTVQEIQIIRDRQHNKCAICDAVDPTDLDHCHTTNRVRWLLCKHCNRGLGAFRDNPEWLEKAAQMLRGD